VEGVGFEDQFNYVISRLCRRDAAPIWSLKLGHLGLLVAFIPRTKECGSRMPKIGGYLYLHRTLSRQIHAHGVISSRGPSLSMLNTIRTDG
jgi:hypothetical protein